MTFRHGKLDREKKEIIRRANYLVAKIKDPEQLYDDMPKIIGPQFRGEWALYTCNMTAIALSNIARLFPEKREWAIAHIKRVIDIAMSSKIREYDRKRWYGEDALDSLNGNTSHITYLSVLALMIGRFKQTGAADTFLLPHFLLIYFQKQILYGSYLICYFL